MAVYTDNPQFATAFLPTEVTSGFMPATVSGPFNHPADTPGGLTDPSIEKVLAQVFPDRGMLRSAPHSGSPWSTLVLSESSNGSQYDLLIDLARDSVPLPDRIACLAGSGTGFHGFKGRAWASPPGNVYLATHFAPKREIPRFEVAFTILATLSVVDALDQIVGLEGRAQIKWVNDILLEGAKVAGVLAYTQTQGRTVTSAILGIGLNVNTTPRVQPTPFVPEVSSLRGSLGTKANGLRASAFESLTHALNRNYDTLLQEGIDPLLERYRLRSLVIGEDVVICSETSDQEMNVLTHGRVMALGENLELIFRNKPEPVRGGRLVLGSRLESTQG